MASTSLVPKACRNCRLRKVRCNREIPCSTCITSKLDCQAASRDRIRTSTGESKASQDVTALQERVTALEQLVKRLTPAEHITPDSSSPCSPQQAPILVDRVALEGESSFRKQTLIATDITELELLTGIQPPHVVDQLRSLRTLLEQPPPEEFISRVPIGDQDAVALQEGLPPSTFAISVLRLIQGTCSLLTLFYPISLDYFEDLCRQVYFPLRTVSVGHVLLLRAMLYVVLSDIKRWPQSVVPAEEIVRFCGICKERFLAAIETYEVHTIPTFEHCLLLYMAALKAQREGDLGLQWRFSSAAAKHCLALGYHREAIVSALPTAESLRIRRLFWHVYFSDKSLVLSLGRGSIIQDFDIDVELYPISQDPGRRPWDTALLMFIKYTKIQAQLYESLYSPASQRHSRADRYIIVDSLAKRLAEWRESWYQLDTSKAYRKTFFDETFRPIDAGYYSTLVLLYRAVDTSKSAKTLVDPCFEAARRSLQSHVAIHARYSALEPDTLAYFAVWIYSYSSFLPFTVTFLHCIAMSDIADLGLLKSSLDILEQTSSLVSSSKRVYDLCKYLYGIAEASVSSGTLMDHQETSASEIAGPSLLEDLSEGSWAFTDSAMRHVSSSLQANDWWTQDVPNMTLGLFP